MTDSKMWLEVIINTTLSLSLSLILRLRSEVAMWCSWNLRGHTVINNAEHISGAVRILQTELQSKQQGL
jgi:hypothetical protein